MADRLAYGAGRAAAHTGYLCDAYRPDAPVAPLDSARLFLRLPVTFVLPGGGVAAPTAFGAPFRQAWADWSYLAIGDYLVGPEGIAFVASIEPPKPMLVVMTNAVVTLLRFGTVLVPGANAYPATTSRDAASLLSGFPASLAVGGVGERSRDGLVDDARQPGFVALLPVVRDVVPLIGDTLMDADGVRLVVNAVERFAGCWRLSLWQAEA